MTRMIIASFCNHYLGRKSEKKLKKRMPKSIGEMKPGCVMIATMVVVMLPWTNTSVMLFPRCKCVNLIFSATHQGKVRVMVYKSRMNSQILIRFMKRLVKGAEKNNSLGY